MNAVIRLDPGRSYTSAEVALLLGMSVVALQACARRREQRDGYPRFVEITPWILAFRTGGGRIWSFCAARERGGPSGDEGD